LYCAVGRRWFCAGGDDALLYRAGDDSGERTNTRGDLGEAGESAALFGDGGDARAATLFASS
jgi:hypothetical protein